ncbi:hypothetical protein QBC47DRAFT_392383 [Echria macrotheca]|uniref:Uncharacterized protein n=1 Tax=Echria macrotheca TaxID=438768 RepID=A0AAJ0B4Q0_9PEZI|nr:hypothetical protein QBC47DRAFT_392383 [Echria macrotheca]
MRDTAVRNCRFETCEALDWEGIADLAGVGMVITYFLEAIITTLLFLTLAVDYQVHRHPSRYHKTHMSPTSTPATHLLLLRRISAAMLGCLDEFLNSSIVFALSMLAAAIFENAYNVLTRGAETTLYATLLTMLLPIFTLFPVAILQATARGTLRRPKLRAAVWALMILLTAVLLGLAMTSFRILTSDDEEDGVKQSFYTSRSAQQNFERWCAPSESELAIRPAIYAGVGTFALTFSVWFTAIRDFRLIPHLRGNKVLRATRRVWWLVVACLGFIGMWTYLVLFTRYRSLIVQRAGYSQQDTRWSFGQVLALATGHVTSWSKGRPGRSYLQEVGSGAASGHAETRRRRKRKRDDAPDRAGQDSVGWRCRCCLPQPGFPVLARLAERGCIFSAAEISV